VLREALADELAGGEHAQDLAAVERRVEGMALRAFDAYVRCREQIHRLRQDELRRSVGSLLRRWHGAVPEPAGELVRLTPPPRGSA
jgi:hypothetical protein